MTKIVPTFCLHQWIEVLYLMWETNKPLLKLGVKLICIFLSTKVVKVSLYNCGDEKRIRLYLILTPEKLESVHASKLSFVKINNFKFLSGPLQFLIATLHFFPHWGAIIISSSSKTHRYQKKFYWKDWSSECSHTGFNNPSANKSVIRFITTTHNIVFNL